MLKRKLLSKKHTFWSMIDSDVKFWLKLFPFIFVIVVMPTILGNIPCIYKFLAFFGVDSPGSVPAEYYIRFKSGLLALGIMALCVFFLYVIVVNIINLIWVLIAKTILSIRYTRLPLTEEEFNASFKGMDFLQVVNELTHYMTFRRINLWLEVVPITISNHLADEIHVKLFELINNNFKDEAAACWNNVDDFLDIFWS